MQLDADPRLAAAAGGAVRYFAEAAGLDHDAMSHLQNAVIAACEEAFEDLSKDQPCVNVTLTWLVDRIEVDVSHKSNSTDLHNAPKSGVGQGLEGVDDVRHEARNNLAITRLTKFIKQGATRR